jgi:putative ABC transport system substrate-binding protein
VAARGARAAAEDAGTQEIEAAFAKFVELKIDTLLLIPDRELFARLAARYAMPTIYYSREYVAAGGLVSYGASFTGTFRQAGNYVGRILIPFLHQSEQTM